MRRPGIGTPTFLDDTPLIGRYNSKLPEVAATHIYQAQTAGIDAFVVNWFGTEDQVTTTPALYNLLDRAEEMNFQVGAVVDVFVNQFHRTQAELEASLTVLVDEVVEHPAYLHYEGKPVILFAFQDEAELTSWDWWELREVLDPNHETIWIAEGLNGCCLYGRAMDGMYAFNMAWADGNPNHYIAQERVVMQRGGSLYIPTISPGWDEDKIADLSNRPNPTSPREREAGNFLVTSWQGALAVAPEIVLVVSWNEFIENSHIEPSVEFGWTALETLGELIVDWRGQPISHDLTQPREYVALADDVVDAYAEPEPESRVIGQMMPDRIYRVVTEDNGLYGVDFSGMVGYVPAEAITFAPLSLEHVSPIPIDYTGCKV